MNVGLFWFFIQAWAEKAGYLSNPFSDDEIDLPVEFASTVLGFWMVRLLSKPLDERSEKFRSTLLNEQTKRRSLGMGVCEKPDLRVIAPSLKQRR